MAQKRGKPVGEYLQELARKPRLARAFRENPERAMAAAGVSEKDRDLVLSGSVAEIRRLLHQQLGVDPGDVGFIVWTIVWPIVYPGRR
jgi:predicted dinucleotide-binding enzyme